MNPNEIDFDQITPDAQTRPERCQLCTPENDSLFGRLNFRRPNGEWPAQYCPMHKQALTEGKITQEQTRLVYTGGKIA